MNDYHLFNEYDDMNSSDQEFWVENLMQPELFWKNHSSSSSEEITNTSLKQHASQHKPLFSSSSMPYILSFDDSTAVPIRSKQYSKVTQEEEPDNKNHKRTRSSSQTQDHIMAERQRRENLTRMFIALSAIIPGLKKMDKASILNNAIDYVKHLQKRVEDLEEKNKKKKMESVVCFKTNKSNVDVAEDFYWLFDSGLDKSIKTFPKVEVRASTKDILIRVLCEKQKDIVLKLLAKLEAHNLSTVCSNVLPIGNSVLNITSIAQMNRESIINMDDLVKLLTKDLLECCNLQ